MTAAPSATWAGSLCSDPAAGGTPLASTKAVSCDVASTAGRWLWAVVAWRQAPGYPQVSMSVADDAGNVWEPCGAPSGQTTGSSTVRVAVWRAAAARPATVVAASPTGFVVSAVIRVIEFTGLTRWVQETPTVTTGADSATGLPALTDAAPPGPALRITVAAAADNTARLAAAGAGWQHAPLVTVTNGTDHSCDLTAAIRWQQASGDTTATWSTSGECAAAAVLTGVLVSASAPAQANPHWPVTTLEIAPGAGPGTPPAETTWVSLDADTTARFLALAASQGHQYELGTLQTGQGTVTLNDPDLALLPPGLGDYAGVDSGTPIRLRMTWPGGNKGYPVNPTPHYTPWSGFIERLPHGWTASTRRGQTQATIVDAWAYCQPLLRSVVAEEAAADQPQSSWPCDDQQGATFAANAAPGNTAVLQQVTSRHGTAGATAGFGSASGMIPGDGASVWEQKGLPAAFTRGGHCLHCASAGFPSLATGPGLAVAGWFEFTDPVIYQPGILWTLKGAKGPVMRLQAELDGSLTLSTWDTAGTRADTTVESGTVLAAGAFHTVVNWAPATGWQVWVNGTLTAASGSPPVVAPSFAWVTFAGEVDRFGSGGCFNGRAGRLGIYPQPLPPARVASHHRAGLDGFDTEPAPSRVERLLSYAGWAGPRLVTTSDVVDECSGALSTNRQQAGSLIDKIGKSTAPAMLMVAPTGAITYLAKGRAYGQPVTWQLGHDTSSGQAPFLIQGARLGWDPTRVLDRIRITQSGGQQAVTPQLGGAEAGAAKRYGSHSDQFTGELRNGLDAPLSSAHPSGLVDLANWIAEASLAPHLRAEQLTVDAAAYPPAWPLVAGAKPGDMAQVTVAPLTAASPVILTGRVTKTNRKIHYAGKRGQVTLTVDFSPEARPLTLDDTTGLGVLDGTTVLTW